MKQRKNRSRGARAQEQPFIVRLRERAYDQAQEFLTMARMERMQSTGMDKNAFWVEQSMSALFLALGLEKIAWEWYWSESAMLMTEALRRDLLRATDPVRLVLPMQNLYIELASWLPSPAGEVGALCLVKQMPTQEHLEMLRWYHAQFASWGEHQQAFDQLTQRVKMRLAEEPSLLRWNLHARGRDGTCLLSSTFLLERATGALFTSGVAFPACAHCQPTGRFIPPEAMCARCREAHVWSMTWIAVALQMLDGVYQTSPGDAPSSSLPPAETEEIRTVTEWQEEPAQQAKKSSCRIHRMRVLRFDACLKPARRSSPHPRGSWLAGRTIEEALRADLDPDAVVYVAYSYGYKRTYRADRYQKSGLQGTKHDIQVPKRRVPVTVGTLLGPPQRTRVKVLASSYVSGTLPALQAVQEASPVTGDDPGSTVVLVSHQEREG